MKYVFRFVIIIINIGLYQEVMIVMEQLLVWHLDRFDLTGEHTKSIRSSTRNQNKDSR
jgi:hypothetical protein